MKNKHDLSIFRVFGVGVLFLALIWVMWPQAAYAAVLSVDPAGTDSGDCVGAACATIGYAISQAADGDTINVAAGTYTETAITVNKDLSIIGAGADVTIVQGAATAGTAGNRVFAINGKTVLLEQMTVRHGSISSIGAGIYNNNGLLTINQMTITDNAGASGGGIYSANGALTVTQSTISGNSAATGGGIYLSGLSSSCAGGAAATIINSTISGNLATSYGGGIQANQGKIILSQSTVTDNTANLQGSGIRGANNVNTCVVVDHTIIAGNHGADDVHASSTAQRFSSLGYNLIGTAGTNVDFGLEFNQTGDVTGVTDPKLDGLADNGGETETHRPLADSLAMNGGDVTCGMLLDQRGEARPSNGNCEIGAVEITERYVASAGSNSGDCTLTTCATVAYAIGQAIDGDVVRLSGTLTEYSITVNKDVTIVGEGADQTVIQAAATPDSVNGSVFIIDPNTEVIIQDVTIRHGRALNGGGVNNGGDLTIHASAIVSNTATNGGGALYNNGGEITVIDSTLAYNSSTQGGAMYNLYAPAMSCEGEANILVRNSTISNNSADYGGGVRSDYGVAEIVNSTITDNSARFTGGGIWGLNRELSGSFACIRLGHSIVAGNQGSDVASYEPNNLPYISLGHNVIGTAGTHVNFTQEFTATGDITDTIDPLLGPLADNGGTVLTHLPLLGSPAIDRGEIDCGVDVDQLGVARPQSINCDSGAVEAVAVDGLLYVGTDGVDSGSCGTRACATISYAISQASAGDLIQVLSGTFTETAITVNKALTITGVSASETIVQGAATAGTAANRVFLINGGVTVRLENMTVRHGKSNSVGGGIYNNNGSLTVQNMAIVNNQGSNGGGIYSSGGGLTVTQSTFYSNTATSGAGIYLSGSSSSCVDAPYATIINSTFSDNTAATYGGGLYVNRGVVVLRHNTITANRASSQGSGVRSVNNSGACTIVDHTIIAGNSGDDVAAAATNQRYLSLGYNVIGTAGTNVDFSQEFNQIGDQTLVNDPQLGPLMDNGGATWTHALALGSPARNKSGGSGVATDQRGALRPSDGLVDSGAFEFVVLITPTLTLSYTADILTIDWAAQDWHTYDVYRSPSPYTGFAPVAAGADITQGPWSDIAPYPMSYYYYFVAESDGGTDETAVFGVIHFELTAGE